MTVTISGTGNHQWFQFGNLTNGTLAQRMGLYGSMFYTWWVGAPQVSEGAEQLKLNLEPGGTGTNFPPSIRNTTFSHAVTYDPTDYNNGPGNHPNVTAGAQTSQPFKNWLKPSGGSWTLYNSSSNFGGIDLWDNSETTQVPTGSMKVGGGTYDDGNTSVSRIELHNTTLDASTLP